MSELAEWLLRELREAGGTWITDDIVNSWLVDHADADLTYQQALVRVGATLGMLRRSGRVGGDRLGWYAIQGGDRSD